MTGTSCPKCGNIQPSGTFETHPTEKPPLKPFRVQAEQQGRTINFGDFDTLELARAGACGTAGAVILVRKPADTFMVEYSKLVGKTVQKIVKDSEAGEPFYGLAMSDGTVAWIEQDPEGNGPGFLRIQS